MMTTSRTGIPSDKPLLTLTRDADSSLWIIEMQNGDDNRLTHALVNDALKPALDTVEREWRQAYRAAQVKGASKEGGKDGRGALIITGKLDQNKFFSNGLDYQNAIKDYNFFQDTYNPLITRILTFPIPVIAALNGHTFAGALILALACDYRIMIDGKERRAWCCMNEIHFGAPWPTSLAAVARAKLTPLTLRALALEGHRFSPDEALAAGIVDVIADGSSSTAVLDAAKKLALSKAETSKSGAYGIIKKELYRHTLEDIAQEYRTVMPFHEDAAAKARL